MELILNESGNPEFAATIAELKEKIESAEANKLNKEAREVSKQLLKFPGLSKQVLAVVRAKIAEYKLLGVIDKFKKELPEIVLVIVAVVNKLCIFNKIK